MSALRPLEFLKAEPTEVGITVEATVDAQTGSPVVQIPIPLTEGRDGFGPKLALTHGGYDPLSPFAFGWALVGLPHIEVDTREGVPVYDGDEIVRYQGQELVPLEETGRPSSFARGDFDVRCYRPRVEVDAVRAERWVHRVTRRVHWRVRRSDGSVWVFGRRADGESRIADPARPEHTFRWLLESAHDRLGNAMVVRHQAEDARGLESASLDATRFRDATSQRYVKRILYGNGAPFGEDDASMPEWHFESVFDYGDHPEADPGPEPSLPWSARADIGTTCRPGFMVRTRRLCRRILMFHRFPAELGEPATLIDALELGSAAGRDATVLFGVRRSGYGATSSEQRTTPWSRLEYTRSDGTDFFRAVRAPLLGAGTELHDLFGEGLPGLLTRDAGGVRYARNLGSGDFGAHELLAAWPVGLEEASLGDFDGDGNTELVQATGPNAGYYRLDRRAGTWETLQRFDVAASLPASEGTVRHVDLSGNGLPDVAILHRHGLTWLPNLGDGGFGQPIDVSTLPERLPTAERPLDRFLADMTGDGLADVVEVLNGSVRYWPNRGGGDFDEPVVMDAAPRLCEEGSYDAARVLLLDIEGTGGADLLYLRADGGVLRATNFRGLAFGELEVVATGAPVPNGVTPQLGDPFGEGSRCITWIDEDAGTSVLRILELSRGPGAHRVREVRSWLGATTRFEWDHSTRHYLRDVASGRGWDTPLPQQRPVVSGLRETEPIGGGTRSQRFEYHDGHYDPLERGFALFAIVETWDVDPRESIGEVEPLLTRRFAHTGELDYASRFARHHYAGDLQARPPPISDLETRSVRTRDHHLALGALTGVLVREELFAIDARGIPAPDPLRITESSRSVRMTRQRDDRHRTGVQVVPRVQVETHYERSPSDPRIVVSRALGVDPYLNPILTLEGALPRRAEHVAFAAQGRAWLTASNRELAGFDTPTRFEPSIPVQEWTFELHLPTPADVVEDDIGELVESLLDSARPFDAPLDVDSIAPIARELTHERVLYWDSGRTAPLPLGSVGDTALPHHSEQATYDGAQLSRVLGGRLSAIDAELSGHGFSSEAGRYYAPSPTNVFGPRGEFHRLIATEAFDGGVQRIEPDPHALVARRIVDEVDNPTVAEIDYRRLAPWRTTDPNETVREVVYDSLGIVVATSRYGDALDAADSSVAHGFAPVPTVVAGLDIETAIDDPEAALGSMESAFAYELPTSSHPLRTLLLTAEQFVHRGPDPDHVPARANVVLAYFDGLGRSIQERMLVEPGPAWTTAGNALARTESEVSPRWLVSGAPVHDAKQQLVATFEPFFHDGHSFESATALRRVGVAVFTSFDALGREILLRQPNGTRVETRFDAWSETLWDANDSVLRADEYRSARADLPSSDPEHRALAQALRHADTPIRRHHDGLGRTFATTETVEGGRELTERVDLDIGGNLLATTDRRGVTLSEREFDRLGRQVIERSADSGEQLTLHDALEREVLAWHETTEQRRAFDRAGRPTSLRITDGTATWLAERTTYGEGESDAAARNLRGRVVRIEDGAGILERPRYGAFGEVVEDRRTLTAHPGRDPDWSGTVSLESDPHTTLQTFDALGRRLRSLLADGTRRTERFLRSGPSASLTLLTPDGTSRPVLAAAVHDAHGRPVLQRLGNDVEVEFTYDEETFRLYRRHAALPGEAPYQDLRHHYDPVGNVVMVDDLAQRPGATRVLRGLTVDARRDMSHDARYRLVEATGRVHQALLPGDYRGDAPAAGAFRGTRLLGLDDGGVVTRYRRSYTYDDADILERWEQRPEGALPGPRWNVEKWVSPTSNRSHPAFDLNGVRIGDPSNRFNARGQLERLPAVRRLEWSPRDELRRCILIERDGGSPDEELYDYAEDSRRLRKTTRRLTDGSFETSQVITLGDCELTRVARGDTVLVSRWSSHASVGDERLATIHRWETDRFGRETDDVAAVREHFHLAGRLGSVALDLDGEGDLLAYEEYFPYGRTAFVAGNAVREVRLRNIRYVGKHQDDSTGFYVFQYRYYAPFIGNWVSPDPAGEVDGPNRYAYARNNPITLVDPLGLQAHVPAWRTALHEGLTEAGNADPAGAVRAAEQQVAEAHRQGGTAYLGVTPDGNGFVATGDGSDPALLYAGAAREARQQGASLYRLNPDGSATAVALPNPEQPLVVPPSSDVPPNPRRRSTPNPAPDPPRPTSQPSDQPSPAPDGGSPEAPSGSQRFDPNSLDAWGEVFSILGGSLGEAIFDTIVEALVEWGVAGLIPGGALAVLAYHIIDAIRTIDALLESLPAIADAVGEAAARVINGEATLNDAAVMVGGAIAAMVFALGKTRLGRRMVEFVREQLGRLQQAARDLVPDLPGRRGSQAPPPQSPAQGSPNPPPQSPAQGSPNTADAPASPQQSSSAGPAAPAPSTTSPSAPAGTPNRHTYQVPHRPLSTAERRRVRRRVRQRTATRAEYERFEWDRRFGNRRRRGVDRFWSQERRRLREGQPGTRNWTDEQRQAILDGRTPQWDGDPIEGHHRHNALDHPQAADDPTNIYPATNDEHLRRWHGGNYQNDTFGQPLNPDHPEDF